MSFIVRASPAASCLDFSPFTNMGVSLKIIEVTHAIWTTRCITVEPKPWCKKVMLQIVVFIQKKLVNYTSTVSMRQQPRNYTRYYTTEKKSEPKANDNSYRKVVMGLGRAVRCILIPILLLCESSTRHCSRGVRNLTPPPQHDALSGDDLGDYGRIRRSNAPARFRRYPANVRRRCS